MPFQMTLLDAWILDLEEDYTQNIKLFSREVILPDIFEADVLQEEMEIRATEVD